MIICTYDTVTERMIMNKKKSAQGNNERIKERYYMSYDMYNNVIKNNIKIICA